MDEQKKKELITDLLGFTVKIDETEEKPIIIMGPDGSKNKNKLRIYAYGGQIGAIPTLDAHPSSEFGLADKGYAKFASRIEWKDEKDHKHKAPNWIEKNMPLIPANLGKKVINSNEDKYEKNLEHILNARNDEELFKNNNSEQVDIKKRNEEIYNRKEYRDLYLTLILAATQCKFTKSDATKGERWIQHNIAKEYTSECGVIDGKPFIITDLEFDLPLTKERVKEKKKHNEEDNIDAESNGKSKPDFVVFDGESFGFVELKYNADSMKRNSNNSLESHFLDFYNVMREYEGNLWKEVYEKCLSRLKCLLDYGVIPKEMTYKDKVINWEDLYKKCLDYCNDKKDNSEFEDSRLWCGFMFVDGSYDSEEENRQKTYVKTEIYEQLTKDESKASNKLLSSESDMVVRGLYCKESELMSGDEKEKTVFDMSKTIKDIQKELEESLNEG